MTPMVVKPMAALSRQGYAVDVLTGPFECTPLARDISLDAWVSRHFPAVTRLSNSGEPWLDRMRTRLHRWAQRRWGGAPDPMAHLGPRALEQLLRMQAESYAAVVTWSPFHSLNPVMVELKRQRPGVRWIAQFGDPWARNPLERRRLIRAWSALQEPATVAAADHLVFSSRASMDLMVSPRRVEVRRRASLIPGCFDPELFPQRAKASNEHITMRHVGKLFGRRTPEPLFQALAHLLSKRRDLVGRLRLELVGGVEPEMLQSEAARRLPVGLVTHVPQVDYLSALERLHDADVLVLLEASVKRNLFLASKLPDYIGAGPPIVGLAPRGATDDMLRSVGAWRAHPGDVPGAAMALEGAIEHGRSGNGVPWFVPGYRETLTASAVAARLARLIDGVSA